MVRSSVVEGPSAYALCHSDDNDLARAFSIKDILVQTQKIDTLLLRSWLMSVPNAVGPPLRSTSIPLIELQFTFFTLAVSCMYFMINVNPNTCIVLLVTCQDRSSSTMITNQTLCSKRDCPACFDISRQGISCLCQKMVYLGKAEANHHVRCLAVLWHVSFDPE